MNYTKPPLTFEQQADQLLKRGMVGDRGLIIRRLASVNYYRLSAYWFPFRDKNGESFKANTRFEVVWERYVFDRHLRLLLMDAIERIEIAVRTSLAYYHSHTFGPFGWADNPASLPGLKQDELKEFHGRIADGYQKSPERFCDHFRTKYGDVHPCLPVWMATELMTFGAVLTFFRGSPFAIQIDVSSVFSTARKVFKSWLFALNTIRNMCAHHSRVWNRELGMAPKIPQLPDWQTPYQITAKRSFSIMTICQYCLTQVAPQTHWRARVDGLLDRFHMIPKSEMGFPQDWKDSPIWKPN